MPAIVRILSVRDTREVEEVGDRFVPVPGSGLARACDRCGREHEVYVDVELEGGVTAVIGVGCARGESMDVQARIKSAVSAAKTRARLAAELAAARAAHAAAVAAWDEVIKLPLPEAAMVARHWTERGDREEWGMGDAIVWVLPGCTFNDDRRRALVNAWRRRRYEERGQKMDPYWHAGQVAELGHRIGKIERKLAALTGAA